MVLTRLTDNARRRCGNGFLVGLKIAYRESFFRQIFQVFRVVIQVSSVFPVKIGKRKRRGILSGGQGKTNSYEKIIEYFFTRTGEET